MKKTTSILFTGDIGFDRYMAERWKDENLLSQELLEEFQRADHVLANVEAAVCTVDDNESHGAYFHTMDPAAISFLEKIRADLWTVANNHVMDAGEAGMLSTRRIAEEKGCRVIGAGSTEEEASEPIYLEEAGGIGIFAVCYGTDRAFASDSQAGVFGWDRMEAIGRRIREIKEKCRWCVIVVHGGEEFAPLPSPYTRDRYVKYLEMGADAVVGHHPHVPESYEIFEDGKAIFYSLGNFVFDTDYQRVHSHTDEGVLVKLTFSEERMDFEAVGMKLIRGEERIVKGPLPAIFAPISAEEYALLAPLGAKAFVAAEMRRMKFLRPKRYGEATQKDWEDYFFSDRPGGYCKGSHMDFGIVYPLSLTAENEEWKKSKLEGVKKYLLDLL